MRSELMRVSLGDREVPASLMSAKRAPLSTPARWRRTTTTPTVRVRLAPPTMWPAFFMQPERAARRRSEGDFLSPRPVVVSAGWPSAKRWTETLDTGLCGGGTASRLNATSQGRAAGARLGKIRQDDDASPAPVETPCPVSSIIQLRSAASPSFDPCSVIGVS
jgi:hypothetical protein